MNKFTPSQSEAIKHLFGPSLVVAGPGSGKTKVFVERINTLITKQRIDPSSILAISYTKEAAKEIKERLIKCCPFSLKNITIGTFHSVFLSLLRSYIPDLSFSLADEKASLNIISQCFFEIFGTAPGIEKAYSLMHKIERGKNLMHVPDPSMRPLIKLYDKKLHELFLLDYPDMLLLFLKLLRVDKNVLEDIRSRFLYILIDEFQDIDPLQFEILRLIAYPLNNIFAVGDDDQSIYGFRGADKGIMLSFKNIYKDAKIIKLRENFRSQKNIGLFSKNLISHNLNRYKKDIRFLVPPLSPPDIRTFRDSDEEKDEVKKIIDSLSPYESLGILVRQRRGALAYTGEDYPENVFLMTFHSAKGLEFDQVVIVHANDEITPGSVKTKAVLEEERRMFYVAVTRAKKSIHIFNTIFDYNSPCKQSRFVGEGLKCRVKKYL